MSPVFKSKSRFRPPAPAKFRALSPVKPATQAGPPSSPRSTSSTSRNPHPLPAQSVALLDDLLPASEPSPTRRSDQATPAKEQLQRTGGSKDVGESRGPGMENPRASHLLDAAWPAMQPIKKDDVTNSQTTDIHTDQDEEEDDFWRHSTQADSTIACDDTAHLETRELHGRYSYETKLLDEPITPEKAHDRTSLPQRTTTLALGHRSVRIGEDIEVFPSIDSVDVRAGKSSPPHQSTSKRATAAHADPAEASHPSSSEPDIKSTSRAVELSEGAIPKKSPLLLTLAPEPQHGKCGVETSHDMTDAPQADVNARSDLLAIDDSPLTSLSSLNLIDTESPPRLGKRKRAASSISRASSDELSLQEPQAFKGSNITQNGKPRKRAFYGKTHFSGVCLRPSEGIITVVGSTKWPQKGPNTKAGLLREICCDRVVLNCGVHWACAGLRDDEPDPEDSWYCPPCDAVKDNKHLRTGTAQEERCIRPDCIKRAKIAIIPKIDDQALFRVVKLIGQKEVERRDGRRILRYLTLWEGWDLCDATWEPEENFADFVSLWDVYHANAQAEGQDTRKPSVILLQEAKPKWDEDDRLKGKRSARYIRLGWTLGEGADGK